MINFIETQYRLYERLKDENLSIDPKLANHPRACAELIETFVQENLYDCIPDQISFYKRATTAKALADVSCYDEEGFYYAFDVKTHNTLKWAMPNLVSYKRLDKFYKETTNVFVIIIINYTVDDKGIIGPSQVSIGPIENIPWEYLAVQGTLGQIQIINADRYGMHPYDVNRLQWMDGFYEHVRIGIKKKMQLLHKELEYFAVGA